MLSDRIAQTRVGVDDTPPSPSSSRERLDLDCPMAWYNNGCDEDGAEARVVIDVVKTASMTTYAIVRLSHLINRPAPKLDEKLRYVMTRPEYRHQTKLATCCFSTSALLKRPYGNQKTVSGRM
eukprot:scaffold4268_cov77-Skeletonema_dohrnii-CCMP3373.AAC.2